MNTGGNLDAMMYMLMIVISFNLLWWTMLDDADKEIIIEYIVERFKKIWKIWVERK